MTASLRALAIGSTLGLLLATRALAHDFWIEPSSFTPMPEQGVTVRLLVGEHFSGDAVARPPPASLHRFVLADARSQASATVPGRAGSDPAGLLRVGRLGAYVVAFHGKPNSVELPADKFNAYLKSEGLDFVLALREQRGQASEPGREIYSRCAKSLLTVGVGAPANDGLPADRALGLPLELIAERRPDLLRDGELLPVRLLHEGRPLAGALVVALHRDNPRLTITQRSDADGRVQLPLDRSGVWLVKAVHMVPAPAGSGADWHSLWASLSFSSGAAAP